MLLKLREKEPAKRFVDAHLLGNGRLGASVYGGVPIEEILINSDTLWSGAEPTYDSSAFYDHFKRAQALTLEGKYKEANEIVNYELLQSWSQAYMPMCSLLITPGQRDNRRTMALHRTINVGEDPFTEYERELDLARAVASVRYARGGIRYEREAFVSYPAQVLAVRLTAQGGPLNFGMSIGSKLQHAVSAHGGYVEITGRAPDHTEPNYSALHPGIAYYPDEDSASIRFAARATIADTDGAVWHDRQRLYVRDASYAVILLAAGDDYAGFRAPRSHSSAPALAQCEGRLAAAAQKGWEALLREHVRDHAALFDRVEIDLGPDITEALPTSARLKMASGSVHEPAVSALATQYLRYLLIAGSRPGSQAANLQGIWNDMPNPPWNSNYTTNINVQMNYWGAEVLALGECHEPMFDLVRETARSGEDTARDYYHARGWVAHHNVDLWRMSVPAGVDAAWAFWPFGGVWMARHLWEHYVFTRDEAFLRDVAYPILKGAARFMLDFLVESRGELHTAPSTSPENKYMLPGGTTYHDVISDVSPHNRFSPNAPYITAVTKSSTMDITMLRELFGRVLDAGALLGDRDQMLGEIERALPMLPPYKVGKLGTLQEWYDDVEECMPGMGHMSHLYGVYPAAELTETKNAEAFRAAELSLMRRKIHGGLTTGWPGAWAISLAARHKNALLCDMQCHSVAAGLGASLLSDPHLQIDAISGWGAGVAEMLIQSHDGTIELLPAAAPSWVDGHFCGLRARGGFAVDARWRGGQLVEGTLRSSVAYPARVKARGLVRVEDEAGAAVALAQNGTATFDAAAGGTYRLVFDSVGV